MTSFLFSVLGGSIVLKVTMDRKTGPFKRETATLELSDILLQLKGRGKKYKEVLIILMTIQVTPFKNSLHKQLSQKCVQMRTGSLNFKSSCWIISLPD